MQTRATRQRHDGNGPTARCLGPQACEPMVLATDRLQRQHTTPSESAQLMQSVLSGKCVFCSRPVR